jgi:hypothetical protein
MLDPTRWQIRARGLAWLRHAYDVAGGAVWIYTLLAGAVVIAAIKGLFSEYPSVALAGCAVFGYYGVLLIEKLLTLWRNEGAEQRLLIEPRGFTIKNVNELENTCTLSFDFNIVNSAHFDIAYSEDDDDFRIGDVHPKPEGSPHVIDIISRGYTISKSSIPLTIKRGEHDHGTGKLTIRYGKSRHDLNIRRVVEFQSYLPASISSDPNRSGYRILRSETEWITR